MYLLYLLKKICINLFNLFASEREKITVPLVQQSRPPESVSRWIQQQCQRQRNSSQSSSDSSCKASTGNGICV